MSAHGGATAPRTLKLLCAGAVKGLVEALQARFLAASGATVEGRFGAVGAMREALLGGAPCDVMIVTEAMLAELRDQGAVAERPVRADRRGPHRRRGALSAKPCRGSIPPTTLKAALRRRAGDLSAGHGRSRPRASTSPRCWRGSASPPRPRPRLARLPERRDGDARPRRERRARRARLHPGDRDPLHPGADARRAAARAVRTGDGLCRRRRPRRHRAGAGRRLHRAAFGDGAPPSAGRAASSPASTGP